ADAVGKLLAQELRAAAPPRVATRSKDGSRMTYSAQGAVALAFNDSEMSEVCCISTDDPDRVGDVVNSLGGDWTGFAAARCSVFCNHQSNDLPGYSLPIGFARDPVTGECTIRPEKHRILAKTFYARSTREGHVFYELAKEGMQARSIGFNPLEEPQPRPS